MEKIKNSVLIVDDESDNIIVLSAILKHDYTVYAAKDGKNAVVLAKKHLPDVILLDIIMHEMDGFDVLTVLKNMDETKNIPVVILSGLDDVEDEKKGLVLGAADYITKPFTPAIVKHRLRNQINTVEHLRTINRQIDNLKSIEYENLKNMLDSTPLSCHLWSRDMKMLDCNEASMKLFKVDSKNKFIKRFFEFSPEFQLNGRLSSEVAWEGLQKAFDDGKTIFDFIHNTSEGILIPCQMTLVRIKLQSDDFVVAYLSDLREHNALMAEIKLQDNLLFTVSNVAGILLQSSVDKFMEDMYICMGMMAKAVNADRVYIWKNHTKNGELYCTQLYEWSEGAEPQQGNDITIDIPYENIHELTNILANNLCINNIVRNMSLASQEQLSPQGILSVFIAPVFLRDEFWGFIGFDDCHSERIFSENEALILRSAGLLIANAMLKNEMTMDLKSSAEKLETALETANAANKAKSNFLSNMSHEIRTPMNAITGMGELLLHEHLNERQKGYVNDIVVSAKSLLGIINDILDFSKIESGKLELNPIDYDFNIFIDQIKSMFVYITQKKGLEFKLECDDNLPEILYGDDLRLRQVLTNIMGNAVKFTEKGYVQLKITASNGSLFFEIKDTGIGIRKDDLPKLFYAFEQVDKSKNRNVVGTGLGLTISKSFVEMMGGNILLESEYGHGTIFTIMIPIITGRKEQIESRIVAKESHTIYAPEANILIVDDNEFNLKVASGLLKLMGIEAETADSGIKAIELIMQNDYDIIFMDHMMPVMDGVETVREIRKLGGKYKNIIIIALTANAVSGAREMFLENDFNDFISKPIDADELYVITKKYLPLNKIRTDKKNEKMNDYSIKEEQLLRKSILTFVKENHNTFEKITSALNSGDTKTAHRIAHTLKSSAGYLRKEELQKAAASLEKSLQEEPPNYSSNQLENLRTELTIVLLELEPFVKEAGFEKTPVVQIEDDKISILFTKLRPLLEKNDFSAVVYVEELQSIEGMKELAERIDDYDFEGALCLLKEIVNK